MYFQMFVNNMYKTNLRTLQFSRQFSRFTSEENETFRKIESWFSKFKKSDIPVDSFEKSFNRASGPGGQNVNKVNTKAELRFPLYSASWIHEDVRQKLKLKFPRYVSNTNEFIVSSDVYRTQKQNMEDCVNRIYECIKEASKVPAQTSVEQQKKVENLSKAYNQKRLDTKKINKDKKASRRGTSSKWD